MSDRDQDEDLICVGLQIDARNFALSPGAVLTPTEAFYEEARAAEIVDEEEPATADAPDAVSQVDSKRQRRNGQIQRAHAATMRAQFQMDELAKVLNVIQYAGRRPLQHKELVCKVVSPIIGQPGVTDSTCTKQQFSALVKLKETQLGEVESILESGIKFLEKTVGAKGAMRELRELSKDWRIRRARTLPPVMSRNFPDGKSLVADYRLDLSPTVGGVVPLEIRPGASQIRATGDERLASAVGHAAVHESLLTLRKGLLFRELFRTLSTEAVENTSATRWTEVLTDRIIIRSSCHDEIELRFKRNNELKILDSLVICENELPADASDAITSKLLKQFLRRLGGAKDRDDLFERRAPSADRPELLGEVLVAVQHWRAWCHAPWDKSVSGRQCPVPEDLNDAPPQVFEENGKPGAIAVNIVCRERIANLKEEPEMVVEVVGIGERPELHTAALTESTTLIRDEIAKVAGSPTK